MEFYAWFDAVLHQAGTTHPRRTASSERLSRGGGTTGPDRSRVSTARAAGISQEALVVWLLRRREKCAHILDKTYTFMDIVVAALNTPRGIKILLRE